MQVCRFDAGEFLTIDKTPEGYIKGTARVTRTGIFIYRKADGTIERQLRHPDEVFAKESLDSLKQIPITNLHPATGKLVTAVDAKALSIGMTGENVIPDGRFIAVPINITALDGVQSVDGGRKEFSLGYTCQVDETPGVYDGEEYDSVQRNIRYNHLALVDKGRAGSDVRLNLDAMDAEEIEVQPPKRSLTMVKVKLDSGIEYDAAPEVKVFLDALQVKLDAAEKLVTESKANVEKLQAVADSATENAKQLQAKLDASPEAIANGVKARVALIKTAMDHVDAETSKKLDSMTDVEIKTAVIKAKFPEAKLDGVSSDYLQARFDASLEVTTVLDSASAQRKAVEGGKKVEPPKSVDSCRKTMIDDLCGAYLK
jgi:hypothetical protein